jgi:ABC-type glycerol-3-phosphate transport system permease component
MHAQTRFLYYHIGYNTLGLVFALILFVVFLQGRLLKEANHEESHFISSGHRSVIFYILSKLIVNPSPEERSMEFISFFPVDFTLIITYGYSKYSILRSLINSIIVSTVPWASGFSSMAGYALAR